MIQEVGWRRWLKIGNALVFSVCRKGEFPSPNADNIVRKAVDGKRGKMAG